MRTSANKGQLLIKDNLYDAQHIYNWLVNLGLSLDKNNHCRLKLYLFTLLFFFFFFFFIYFVNKYQSFHVFSAYQTIFKAKNR